MIAADDEAVIDVVSRIAFHETGGRALIVITDNSEPRSFRIMAVGRRRTHTGADSQPRTRASIGMLYASLHPCGTYVPSEWMKMLTFERLDS